MAGHDSFAVLRESDPHNIVQTILGHPGHLCCLEELEYYLDSTDEPEIREALERLLDAGYIDTYTRDRTDDWPSRYYGPTEAGLEALDATGILEGVPVMRAVHDRTQQPPRIAALEDAPRPPLPESVATALQF